MVGKRLFSFSRWLLFRQLKGGVNNVVLLSRKHTIFDVKFLPNLGCKKTSRRFPHQLPCAHHRTGESTVWCFRNQQTGSLKMDGLTEEDLIFCCDWNYGDFFVVVHLSSWGCIWLYEKGGMFSKTTRCRISEPSTVSPSFSPKTLK